MGANKTYILVVRARVLPFAHYISQHGCAIWLRQYNGFVRSPEWVCLETFPEDYSTTHTLAPAQNTLPVETLFLFGCAVIVHRVKGLLGHKLAFLARNQGHGSRNAPLLPCNVGFRLRGTSIAVLGPPCRYNYSPPHSAIGPSGGRIRTVDPFIGGQLTKTHRLHNPKIPGTHRPDQPPTNGQQREAAIPPLARGEGRIGGIMSVFHRFANLPPEIRLMVWAEAVCLDNKDRILILEHRYKHILATQRLLHTSGVFGATQESREVALRLYPVRFAFRMYDIVIPPGLPVWPSVDDTLPTDDVISRRQTGPPSERVIYVSFERDIFFLGLGQAHWDLARLAVYPHGFPNAFLFNNMRRTTVSLTREQRGMIERIMEATRDSPWTRNPLLGDPPGQGMRRLLTAADLGPLDHRYSNPLNNNVYRSVRECHHIVTDDECQDHSNTMLIDIVFRHPLGVHGFSGDASILGTRYRVMKQPCLKHDQLLLSCDVTAYNKPGRKS